MPSFRQIIGLWALLSLGSVLVNFQGVHEERIRSDSPRVIHFAGLAWQVKAGRGLGPGNNNWSDSPQSVWVDSDARLHLRIRKEEATWYSAQINSVDFVPFGLYRFFVQTSLHDLDDNVVLGLFLYGDDDHEIDIEFLRRHPASDANMVYVVQPYSQEGNRHPFLWQWAGPSIHDIEWQPDGITFRSIRGHDLRLESLMHLWRYEGTSIPVTQDGLRVQMNLWLLDPSMQSQEVEIIIADLEAPPPSTSP